MKKRTLIQVVALATVLPLAVVGCGDGGTAGASSTEDVAAKADHHYAVAMTGVV